MDQSTHFSTQANRTIGLNFPKTAVIGFLLVVALIAFEIFNFDTTRYALQNLLGDVNFWGLRWATQLILPVWPICSRQNEAKKNLKLSGT